MQRPLSLLLPLLAAAVTTQAFDIRDLYTSAVKGDLIYAGNSGSQNGRCGLGPPSPAGIPWQIKNLKGTVGVSSDMYAFSPCGVCVRVFLPDGSGTEDYFINDDCTACTWSELNVGADGEGRRSGLTWMAIPCDVGGHPVEYLFQGSHDYYLKIQPRTARCPVGMVALKGKDGQWIDGIPTPDHFFTWQAQTGEPFTFPITLKTTSIFGEEIVEQIGGISETPVAGSTRAQFSGCGPPASAPPAPSAVTAPAAPTAPTNPAVPDAPTAPAAPAAPAAPSVPMVDTTTPDAPAAPTAPTAITPPTPPSIPEASNATNPIPPTTPPTVTITQQPPTPAAAASVGSDPTAPVLKNQTTVNVVNNGTHEITATCTTIVRDLSKSPKNPKGNAPKATTTAAVASGKGKQEQAVKGMARPAMVGAAEEAMIQQEPQPRADGLTPLNRDWPVVEHDQDVHVWSEGTNEITKTCTTVIRKVT